ncbi:MAG: type II secretion system F family protein [Planctomycetota bacterium]
MVESFVPVLIGVIVLLGAVAAGGVVGRRQMEFRARLCEVMARATARGLALVPLLERAEKEHRGRRRKTLAGILQRMRAGIPLSESLASAPGAFPPQVVSAVRAAEGTAALAGVLADQASDAVGVLAARQRALLAVLYPALLCVVLLVTHGFWVVWMDDAELWYASWGPRWILRADRVSGIAVALVLTGVLALLMCARRFGSLRVLLPGARLRGSERLLRNLSSLVAGHLPLHTALRGAAPACGNRAVERGALQAADLLEQGGTTYAAWAVTGLPESIRARASASGPSSAARLCERLRSLADECARRHNALIDRLLRWLHPVSLLVVGVLVAFMLGAVFAGIRSYAVEAGLW